MSADAKHVPLSKADRLRQDADAAGEVRRLSEHPDVVALAVERVRKTVDVLMWLGIALGLAFTMVNVQTFAAEGAAAWSLPWVAAWLLDPMVSLVLIAVLRAEQITARYELPPDRWANRTKWFAFLATYTMNTWQSWAALSLSGVVLHSVPPFIVFLAAEAAPGLRDQLTKSVTRAAETAAVNTPAEPLTTPAENDSVTTTATPVAESDTTGPETVAESPAPRPRQRSAARARGTAAGRASGHRKGRDAYVSEARAAWAPGIEITPAWVREVTGCKRTTSKNVADALRAQLVPATPAAAEPVAESEPDPAQQPGIQERSAA
ncbi:hypothetical protein [Amycolatopsis cihanbeyliensis]|uniref:DUF2637 domain-containing protein n=1 Tax=Amycolatopsis cihanbeyliensis TaxID=1128664 RepID=A0A542DJL7_AMYCI|nr:hypothetical protein [Amycolatopsis cihanbeyliensis]TQJ03266.1 hypothetical protein FB471_3021 [Amycolatopsis cihanbeyliensis]